MTHSTLTSLSESLKEAKRIAHSRRVSVSGVIAEALAEGLRVEAARERLAEIVGNYRAAFSGFSDDELAILDGVVLEQADS
ncbi:MAG: hypothetical protein JWN34_3955 [Bryobacterales bacterium]|nr:hypothetical protein [Bryobacterales bacterium]